MSWGLDKLLMFLKQRGFLLLHTSIIHEKCNGQPCFWLFSSSGLTSLFSKTFLWQCLKKSACFVHNSTSLSIQALTLYSATSPASRFTFLSRTPYEILHFSSQPLEAVKFLNSTFSKHFFISMASSFNIDLSGQKFAAHHFLNHSYNISLMSLNWPFLFFFKSPLNSSYSLQIDASFYLLVSYRLGFTWLKGEPEISRKEQFIPRYFQYEYLVIVFFSF